MKNSEIHDGFNDKDLRKVLGELVEESWSGGSLEFWRAELQKAQEQYDLAKKRVAVNLLLEKFGYSFFDVSDEVSDYAPEGYINFIGTEEEYKQLLGKIKGEGETNEN